jgi:sulfur transfer complex TusBCD TusB component (DsrH family)
MKVLQIIETAYRATIEEQDDTVIWITHAMAGAGAALAVLLCGNAVNYLAADQDASGLCVGAWRQSQPPRVAGDLAGLLGKGVAVYCLAEDLEERGLRERVSLEGIRTVPRAQVAGLFDEFDQIWHW